MTLLSFTNQIIVVISIVVVTVVLISLIVLFALKRNNKNKYLTKLDNLLGEISVEEKSQIDAYLTRLKNISKKNDDYVDIYNQISLQFENLMTTEREKLILRQKGLKERIQTEAKMKKPLIDQIKSFENAINQYKKEIAQIKRDLESYFKEGDELRIRLTELQKQFQQINQDVEKYSNNISICKTELMAYLSDIEMYFDVFDSNLSAAKYKEANKNLTTIKEMIFNVYGHIETMAQYCRMVEVIIPSQLQELSEKNDKLEEEGYVVSHAKVHEVIDNVNELLEACKLAFKNLCFADFVDISNDIQNKLTEVHARLDQEVVSKKELDEKYLVVSEKIATAESEFISTKRSFYLMLEYYKIPTELHEKFEEFQSNATKLSDLKREYDQYLFVNAKNPASFMLIKVSKMEELSDLVIDDIKFFDSYFTSIKDYVENTYEKTNNLLIEITKVIGKIRYLKCKAVYEKYIERVTNTLDLLKEVNNLLLAKPIELEILQTNFSSLVSKSEELVALINNDLDNYQTVEKCIVYANPLRSQFSEVDDLLKEIEELFKNQEYSKAQEKLNYILNNYHPAAFDTFKR